MHPPQLACDGRILDSPQMNIPTLAVTLKRARNDEERQFSPSEKTMTIRRGCADDLTT